MIPVEFGTLDQRVDRFRRFNRFFTRKIGVLEEKLLKSSFSLAEARILFEMAHAERLTATDLCRELGLDAGYLSRILSRFEKQGLAERIRSEQDGRQFWIRLTPKGRETYADLDRRSREQIAGLMNGLDEEEQKQMLLSMHTIESILDKKTETPHGTIYLRNHRPGDMGWVIHRHGALYHQEYGWDERFEALVARIAADFIDNCNPEREICIMAEMNGEIVGSVFVVQVDETTAKLRLLLVEPKARGLGLGNRLVQESIAFAKRTGYRKMVLWTHSVLEAARHIYAKTGFRLVEQEAYTSFGKDLISETWELLLE